MFLKLVKSRHARLNNDAGIALVMVVATTTVLTLFIAAAFVYALGAQRKAVGDQNWNSALAAAYAGIEEYQSRLAEDTSYLRWGNPAAPFSAGSSVTLPPTTNKAFGLGVNGTWADVAHPSSITVGSVKSQFRYEINNSSYANTGTLRIRSTGRVGDETRTIVADLRQQGFVDFLYFTDFEIQDPDISGAAASCKTYAWAGRGSGCSEIAFGSGDTIAGPAHTNDTFRICDATFKGAVTSGYNPASGLKYLNKDSNGSTCTGQSFELAGYPAYGAALPMPAANTQLRQETRSDLTASSVPRPGCLYTGPTEITFNASGTITVKSPWTKKTRVAGDPATSGTTPTECGTIAQLGSAAGATFTPPENNVLYVQSVPVTSTDPNYWASGVLPNTNACKGATTSPASSTPAGNGLGYPLVGEVAPSTSYNCLKGDAFLKGTFNGAMTIGTENFVYITGDIIYADANDDMLGLVGQNAIFIWNPVKNTGSSSNPNYVSLLANTNRRVDSSLLSVAHTIQVQNYDKGGSRGTLTVNGAMAQKFRGIVRNGANGYLKNYVYDARLRYTAPPKFLAPAATTYGVNVWIEVKPAFKPTGAAN
jgi:Tfp pilus assembly protein PilX